MPDPVADRGFRRNPRTPVGQRAQPGGAVGRDRPRCAEGAAAGRIVALDRTSHRVEIPAPVDGLLADVGIRIGGDRGDGAPPPTRLYSSTLTPELNAQSFVVEPGVMMKSPNSFAPGIWYTRVMLWIVRPLLPATNVTWKI